MNKKRVAIIGAGDLGQQIAHFISFSKDKVSVGFFDDFSVEKSFCSIPILGKIDDIQNAFAENKFDSLIIGIGYSYLRFKDDLFLKLKTLIPFETIVHPSAIVDPSAEIMDGCIIYPGCIIDQRVKVFPNTLLNLGVIISHDTTIGRSNFIAPGVVFSGFCETSERVFIGSNSTIKNSIRITKDVNIGAGTNIVKNISAEGIYYGNPSMKS